LRPASTFGYKENAVYQWLLAVHILAAVAWVGGAATTQVLAIRLQRSGEDVHLARFAADVEWIGKRIYLPASIVVLLAGIGLVTEGGWGFTPLWILVGLVGIAFSALVGSLFLGPESGRVGKLIAEKGAGDDEVRRRIDRLFLVSRVELVILFLVVADMALKPGS
jgi:hypothetical protein